MRGICNYSFVLREVIVRFYQIIKNLTFVDVEISFVVIRLGVTRLKNTEFLYLLVVVWGKGHKETQTQETTRLSFLSPSMVTKNCYQIPNSTPETIDVTTPENNEPTKETVSTPTPQHEQH